MQPGNLVFLVIVAIWAVYLVQHWIHRREHVATARSVDRFSEAMRVLERRSPLPRAELAAPHPPSYAVRPASARPALVVKRAPAVSGGIAARIVTSEGGGAGTQGGAPASPGQSGQTGQPGQPGRSGRSQPAVAFSSRAASPSRAPFSSRARLVRRVRGLAFLLALVSAPVTLVLSLVHVLPWVSLAIAVAAVVVVAAGLRASVKRDVAVRRAAQAAARRRYSAPPVRSADVAASGEVSWARPSEGVAVVASAPDAQSAPTEVGEPLTVSARHTGEVFDVSAVAARPDAPSTTPWSPVPVPPPTYTLKDAATRTPPVPAEVSQVPVPIEVEDDELERLMAQRHRRVVG
ncbi:MAG: hypothetical protein ABI083_00925 [Lapillicoccus sp.]